jgi:hypothetical protein
LRLAQFELGFALATEQAEVEPTMLLLDNWYGYAAKANALVRPLLEGLPEADAGFQTVVTGPEHAGHGALTDWNVITTRATGNAREVEILQTEF